ncbi:MAG: hypothetical protein HEQ38_12525 [Gemmatimonas sp.]|nr:hypothetical protein [Gemmatimonas sp.]
MHREITLAAGGLALKLHPAHDRLTIGGGHQSLGQRVAGAPQAAQDGAHFVQQRRQFFGTFLIGLETVTHDLEPRREGIDFGEELLERSLNTVAPEIVLLKFPGQPHHGSALHFQYGREQLEQQLHTVARRHRHSRRDAPRTRS